MGIWQPDKVNLPEKHMSIVTKHGQKEHDMLIFLNSYSLEKLVICMYLFWSKRDLVHVSILKDIVICWFSSHLGSFYSLWKETGIAMSRFVLPKTLDNLSSLCTSFLPLSIIGIWITNSNLTAQYEKLCEIKQCNILQALILVKKGLDPKIEVLQV